MARTYNARFRHCKSLLSRTFRLNLEQSKVTNEAYEEIHVNGTASGGMMQITEKWGENWQQIPSHWMTYVAVDDVAETVEKIKENGGGICVPPFDAPGVGKMSVVNDPSGITFSVIQFVKA